MLNFLVTAQFFSYTSFESLYQNLSHFDAFFVFYSFYLEFTQIHLNTPQPVLLKIGAPWNLLGNLKRFALPGSPSQTN